jgi:hypothetical protein
MRLVKFWKLSKELSSYLREGRNPKEAALRDLTSSQFALVPYQPNVYEQMLNAFKGKGSQECIESSEMEIEYD